MFKFDISEWNAGTGTTRIETNYVMSVSSNLATPITIEYQDQTLGNAPFLDYQVEIPAKSDNTFDSDVSLQITHKFTQTQGEIDVPRFTCDDAAVWTAPEVPGFDFVGWYSIGDDVGHDVFAYQAPESDFTLRISTNRQVTWGQIRQNGHFWNNVYQYIDSGSTYTHNYGYINFLRLVYERRNVVLLDPNGGELLDGRGRPVNHFVRVTFGEPYGPLPVPTYDGMVFLGWYTAKSGGTRITADTVATEGDAGILYAQWSPLITLNANGGKFRVQGNVGGIIGWTFVDTIQVSPNGDSYPTLPAPFEDYYANPGTFIGYFTAPYGGSRVQAGNSISAIGEATLYAHWSSASRVVTVTFHGNDGSPASQTFSYSVGAPYGWLPEVTRAGYVFDGWYAANGNSPVTPSSIAGRSPTDLYAHWTSSSATSAVWAFGGGNCVLAI